MALMLILKEVEQSGLSVWLRESDSFFAFWFVLALHAIGMSLLVGASVVIDLRLLGMAPDLPLAPLKKFYGFIWFGFWIQVISGVLLLIAYPTKSFTNPDFYLKMVLIALGVGVMQMLRNRVFTDPGLNETVMMAKGRVFAILSIILWVGAVTAGRLLAYTYSVLTAQG